MDISGRRFDRMTVARKSLLHVQMGMHAVDIGDEDTVKRRARSRKPRGKRRNTIAGTDQKEIEEVAGNGFVHFSINKYYLISEIIEKISSFQFEFLPRYCENF